MRPCRGAPAPAGGTELQLDSNDNSGDGAVRRKGTRILQAVHAGAAPGTARLGAILQRDASRADAAAVMCTCVKTL